MIARKSTLILFLSGFLVYAETFSQGSWEKISMPTGEWLRSVYFIDSLRGWVSGNGGLILHTEDGGDSWTFQQSNTEQNIVDIFFLDEEKGWATAFNYTTIPYGTVLLKTRDGGQNWDTSVYPEADVFMNCVLYLDSLRGWMGGSPHALVRTFDGGMTWSQAQIDTATLAFFPVLKINFYNDQYGYACGGMFDIAGVIWRTWDGGDHWYAIDVADAPADEVRGLHCFDSLHVIGAGGDPDFGYGVGVIRTDDGGLHWDYQEVGYQGNCYDLDFVSDTEAWAPLGPRRKFIYSTDGGVKWTETDTPDSSLVLDVCFPDSLHGYAVGTEGAMLRYIPPEAVFIKEYSHGKSNGWSVTLCPNPIKYNSPVTLDFSVPGQPGCFNGLTASSDKVIIYLYDLYGHELGKISEKDLSPGDFQLVMKNSDLSSGMYILRIVFSSATENTVVVKKLVVSP